MSYRNTEAFEKAQRRVFARLRQVDQVLRVTLLDALVLIKSRIQQQGQKADGSSIGNYSPGYRQFRQQFGRQTNLVDLTFSGDLMRNFTLIPDGTDALGLGFTWERESTKASDNETRFGGVIFDLTDAEEAFIAESVEKRVNEILNNY